MENVKQIWWSKTYSAPMYKSDDGETHNGSRLIMDDVYNHIWEMTDGKDTEDIPDDEWLYLVDSYLENYCMGSGIKYLGIK